MERNYSDSYELVIRVNNTQLNILKAMGAECDKIDLYDTEIVEKSVQNRINELCEEFGDYFLDIKLHEIEIEGQQIQRDQMMDYEISINCNDLNSLASNYEYN